MAILILATAIAAALGFVVPLYMQLVQGYSALKTGVALLPFAVTVFAGAIASATLATRFPARPIIFWAQMIQAVGLLVLAFAFENEWSAGLIVLGLCLCGVTIGVMLSVLSMVLVSASSPELGGDVGALRGTGGKLGTALGTALMGLVLSISLHTWSATAAHGMSIGLKCAVQMAKVLTATGFDLLVDSELRQAARADFERRTAGKP